MVLFRNGDEYAVPPELQELMTRVAEQRTIIENQRAEIARLLAEEVGNLESELCLRTLRRYRQVLWFVRRMVGRAIYFYFILCIGFLTFVL